MTVYLVLLHHKFSQIKMEYGMIKFLIPMHYNSDTPTTIRGRGRKIWKPLNYSWSVPQALYDYKIKSNFHTTIPHTYALSFFFFFQ